MSARVSCIPRPTLVLPRHTILDGLNRHVGRLSSKDLGLLHGGHDVVRIDASLFSKIRDRMRSGNSHFVGDLASAHHQCSLENAREADGVVYTGWESHPAQ